LILRPKYKNFIFFSCCSAEKARYLSEITAFP
jgi:hypothetical protein